MFENMTNRQILGVSYNASLGEIVSAFRQRSMETHPDRIAYTGMSLEAATAAFQKVNAAYQGLQKGIEVPAAPRAPRPAYQPYSGPRRYGSSRDPFAEWLREQMRYARPAAPKAAAKSASKAARQSNAAKKAWATRRARAAAKAA